MRHLRYTMPALLAVLVLAWLLWPAPTRLDDMGTDAHAALFRLPGVAQVTRTGPTRPARRVVHVLDYHVVPDELARADGHDPAELARKVDRVQQQQAELFVHLHRLGVRSVHVEGLTEQGLMPWNVLLDFAIEVAAGNEELRNQLAELRPGPEADKARAEIEKMEQSHQTEIRRIGALALLAIRGIRLEALPLDDEKALEKATPKVVKGEAVLDMEARKERQKAIVDRLPEAGLVVIVLGAMHDLGPLLGEKTEYLRVELAAVREAMRR